jgi:NAD(P)-dependent dehydrogenase (short-subunit alcohol dehydrogenase family)
MQLEGKTCVVTGAAGGIGRETVLEFCARGARVVAADLRPDGLEEIVALAVEKGGTAIASQMDVTVAAQVKNTIDLCEQTWGRVDVVFNNAGIFPGDDGSVLETSEETWAQVMDVNLKGVFLGCRYAVAAMLRCGGGSIINTASFVALMGSATSQSAYTASKGGVLALTREIAVEYARKGIRANALCPGPVNTPLLAELLRDPEARQRRLVHIPVGRLAEAGEIARAVVFLASDDSSFVTGTEFTVDGGITAAYVTPES